MAMDQAWWDKSLTAFQREIGYRFQNERLIHEALTHASFAHEAGIPFWNERLEFLGDAVLELCVSEMLFVEYAHWDEGLLTQERARLVCEGALARLATQLNIPPLLRMGRGLERQGGRENASICADAVESILGAIFLDGGFDAARQVVRRLLLIFRHHARDEMIDPKSKLQHMFQEKGWGRPEYDLVSTEGPSHDMVFRVTVRHRQTILGSGTGATRKEAEVAASRAALEALLPRRKQGPYSSVKHDAEF